jgi:hypothetical protein
MNYVLRQLRYSRGDIANLRKKLRLKWLWSHSDFDRDLRYRHGRLDQEALRSGEAPFSDVSVGQQNRRTDQSSGPERNHRSGPEGLRRIGDRGHMTALCVIAPRRSHVLLLSSPGTGLLHFQCRLLTLLIRAGHSEWPLCANELNRSRGRAPGLATQPRR